MNAEKFSKIYKPTPVDGGALLPYEWPGSYFIGEEETKAVTKVLRTRSPFRYYGHTNEEPYSDRLEKVYCERLNRKHALAVNSGTVALSIAIDLPPWNRSSYYVRLGIEKGGYKWPEEATRQIESNVLRASLEQAMSLLL